MNIPDKFDQYFENRLSEGEKMKFENDLHEQDELKELYKAYFQINRILKNELYSPVLDINDQLLDELTISQRLEIENDIIRFGNFESPEFIVDLSPENEKITVQTNFDSAHPDPKASGKEAKFIRILKNPSREKTSWNLKRNSRYIGIAAALIISFFAGKQIVEYFFSGQKELTAQELYKEFYNPNEDSELKSLDFDERKLKSAEFYLNRSNINSSVLSLNQLNSTQDEYELSLLFLGLISLERNDFQEANKCFATIRSFENSLKIHSASFYLALSYIYQGRQNEAKLLLEELIDTKNPYRKTAGKILRTLKQE